MVDLRAIAQTTLDAFDRGHYANAAGATVALGPALAACLAETRLYTPEALAAVVHDESGNAGDVGATFAVANETTLNGARRLAASGEYARVGVLNFASARHAGGGFLRGARAQEESLARSSALYLSQLRCPDYYAFNRALSTCLYSDHMIASPVCPVIRDDEGAWLDTPFLVDFITSPAPNAGAILRNEPHNRDRITPTLHERAGKVLALAAHMGCEALVLGAWGCGVFQNDPATVASVFHDHLHPDGGAFAHRFRHILFAVYNRTGDQATYRAFASRFPEFE